MIHAVVFAALAAFAPAQDSVRVEATLSEESVAVGETVLLQVRVEAGAAAPESIEVPPLPPELEQIGVRNYSQFQFNFPGGRSRVVRREFVLLARAPGRLRIAPIEVEVAGGRYRTRPLMLTIMAASAGGGPAAGSGSAAIGDPARASGPDGEVLLHASLAPDTVYIGEQVTLRSEAMFSAGVRLRLRHAPEYQPPMTSGFWTQDLPERLALESRVVGDRVYQVQTFRRAYFPLSPGRYTLPPARLLYEVRRGFPYRSERHELESDSLRVIVLPLPEENRPPIFTGAVGRFTVRARLEPAEVPAGEAALLTLEVEGEGNIKTLPPPALPVIDGVQLYPPSEESEVDVVDGRVRGVKRFTWVLIPSEPGRLELPSVAYAYFDPDREEYAIARAESLALDVRPGAAPVATEDRPATIHALKRQPSGAPLGWVRSRGFAVLQLVPLLGLAVLFRRRHGAEHSRPPSRRALSRWRHEALDALRPLAEAGDPGFYGRFAESVRDWLAARLGGPGLHSATPDSLGRILEDHGVGQGTARGLAELVARAERARYEPDTPAVPVRAGWLDEAERLLDALDRQARRPGRTSSRRGAYVLWLALVPVAPAHGPADPRAPASAVTAAPVAFTIPRASTDVPRSPNNGNARGSLDRPDRRHSGDREEGTGSSDAGTSPDIPILFTGRASLQAATGEPPTTFEAAAAAYGSGAYEEARRALLDYLAQRPDDANAWYNLGNAYFRTGDSGRAVWAWLRAARLDPRDPDPRHNLTIAGAAPELVRRATPALPLSGDEQLLLAGLAWIAGAAGFGAYLLQRRRGAAIAGTVAVVVALGLVGGWAAPRLGSATGVVLDPRTQLLAAPAERAEGVGWLDSGAGVIVVERGEDWLRVITLGGEQGWVERDRVGVL